MLNQDFKEFIQLLNDNQVNYLVIGGYAVAVHGHPRYTKDIDIWIEISEENSQKIITALAEFGFGSLGLTAQDFQEPHQIIQLGYPPNRIDLITSPDGIDFQICYASKIEVMLDDIAVKFIDLDNLKKNKLASGRLQDLADLENLR
ncbi:DUF6036 family nucleotidyltransferase [Pseudanabaena mucicola]|uniref:DUF6036 domain-containing protein n=1 Tax=Pseudanabaena mucicola FACHB-723 TaxID=2692860 RepID=A0ABR7ZTC2_9CYAN|nr:DUF6036 family nucleotidyltransferase [Pseudanabaena mucicola]MBD2186710.1 hypothetical protein [Pseudanabaena mucicola FACHB-723]MCL1489491.1 hypothetical protein [Pseudanabaena sp. Salubria-1]